MNFRTMMTAIVTGPFHATISPSSSTTTTTTTTTTSTNTIRRSFAVYAVGEGWTGAMTRQYVQETIPGHVEEEDEKRTSMRWSSSPTTTKQNETKKMPVMIYPKKDIQSVSAGWGSSAILDTQGQIHLVGRPQDLMNLFRLHRMPIQVRKWANHGLDPSDTTIVGTMISKLIGFATNGSGGNEKDEKNTIDPKMEEEDKKWELAKEYSLLHDWTKLDLSTIGDSKMTHIYCSAGIMAMIGTSGTLYTMGLNNRGQCGIGRFTNNVWTPQRVVGINAASSSDLLSESTTSASYYEQEEPVIQVSLGFQQGYALTQSGKVYSWGKSNRGQLGREIESDQDCIARQIQLENMNTNTKKKKRVIQIASGLHHGALLTDENEVYIWGKNMMMDKDTQKPKDVTIPRLLTTTGRLPNENIKGIACGSHHTAILMEDGSLYAMGIASDEAVLLSDPVLLLEPGLIEFPLRQFTAHHDRTTIIDNTGLVLEAQLWKDERLQEYAAFTPSYVDALEAEGHSIQAIHRGWLHTLIVTK